MLAEINRTGEKQISLTDPDSRAMAAHMHVAVGYNVQIAVDIKNTISNSELSIFPNTQHIVMEFYPERVAEMTIDFFGKQN